MYMHVYDWTDKHTINGGNGKQKPQPSTASRDETQSQASSEDEAKPRKSAIQTKLTELRGLLAYMYLLWELYTVTYMMEPAEKVVVSIFLLFGIGLLIWAALTYLPGHVIMVFQFLADGWGT